MRFVPILALILAPFLVAGCGSDEGGDFVGDRGARESESPAPGGSDGATELDIVVKLGEGMGKRTFSLTCDPPGGDHPKAGAACRQLAELEDPFAPVPPRTACTEIYGGPQTATVTGTFKGEPVDAEFSRTDGCQIARWDAHSELLVVAGGAGI